MWRTWLIVSINSMVSPSTTFSAVEVRASSTRLPKIQDMAEGGITGSYDGHSLSLMIIIAFLIGLAIYNAIELLLLVFITFQRYRGLYFWSLIVAGVGIIPYSLGFLIKFFRLVNPDDDPVYLPVVMLTIGWYMMITGQSVVLWSRLHLVTNSRCVLRYTLWMIIFDAIILHIPTTVLTFGSNSNNFSDYRLRQFVKGYMVMERIQMVGFALQEGVLSAIYIKETSRLLQLSQAIKSDTSIIEETASNTHLKSHHVRKTMVELLAINAIIIIMDCVLLSVEFANLYLIQTVLKGAVYSIKLKLEFAVLSRLVQLVRSQSEVEEHSLALGLTLSKTTSRGTLTRPGLRGSITGSGGGSVSGPVRQSSHPGAWPDFVDPSKVMMDFRHAESMEMKKAREVGIEEEDQFEEIEGGRWKKRKGHGRRESWIEEEMDRYHIG
ncbi:hypothetical protein P154DRAFT_350206 [Amniculicola lignicola CBS 123094]|uniref:DUF7703 domain-containing protein n=1 Tax=Amniculicola lignicola CBS 123094 TaxID=1392246 RepID=A0A6A5WC18_9PLEO|nr:hypothetical protein P154DRAFT_350206 [Amniculicola lignicola CBS 123094]